MKTGKRTNILPSVKPVDAKKKNISSLLVGVMCWGNVCGSGNTHCQGTIEAIEWKDFW